MEPLTSSVQRRLSGARAFKTSWPETRQQKGPERELPGLFHWRSALRGLFLHVAQAEVLHLQVFLHAVA